MAHPVTALIVELVPNVTSEHELRVRNDGPGAVSISKDPSVVAGGPTSFVLAANAEEPVQLDPGEALYAICAAGVTASVEII